MLVCAIREVSNDVAIDIVVVGTVVVDKDVI
jgi:hypothetical protein